MLEIKGFENYLITRDGEVINKKTGRILKQDINNCGYARVTLSKKGKTKRFFVHRLVALHYIPNPEMCKQVNHKNARKISNEDVNLEWATPSSNIQHAFEIGIRKVGESHHNSTISNDVVKRVCEMISQGFIRGDVIKETGVSKHQVDDIRRRKTWSHISKDYVW